MSDLLPYVVIGITAGSIYGIAGMGLVLTYKTSGIFNFAHGSVAAGAGYVFYELRDLRGLPWPVAAFLCVFVVSPLFGLAFERLSRALGEQPLTLRIVATIGLLGALTGAATLRYGAALVQIAPYLPTRNVRILGVNFGVDQLITTALAAALAAGLYVFFRFSRLGVAMRAVVEDPDLVSLGGVSPVAVRRWSWVIGSSFAGLSGLLLAPIFGLDAPLLTLVVVYSFGAAAVGAFSSLPLTYAGGLGIGILTNISTKYVVDYDWLRGWPPSVPFVVLFVALLVTPREKLVDAAQAQARAVLAKPSAVPMATRRAGLAVLGVVLVVLPALVGSKLPVYTSGLVFVILYLSFRLLVQTSGQVSLCHATFAAVGAAAFSHFTTGAGIPWLLALVLAGLVCVPVGAIVAAPAVRLSGLFLAVGTLGFGILAERLFFTQEFMFGAGGSLSVPRPALPFLDETTDTAYYYVVLAIVAATMLLMRAVHASRLGRLLHVLAQSPTALTTNGASANVARLLAFTLSAFTAGVSGALFGALFQSINGAAFSSFQSLQWLTIMVLAGPSRFGSAFIAGFLTSVLPSYGSSDQSTWMTVVYGGLVLAYAALAGRSFTVRAARGGGSRLHARLTGRSPVADRLRAAEPEAVPA